MLIPKYVSWRVALTFYIFFCSLMNTFQYRLPRNELDAYQKTKEAQGIDVNASEMINTKTMFERIPNLGLVIDLTNTKKYYNSKNVTDFGIEYKKIFVPGQKLPPPHIYKQFMSTVTDFLRRNAENDKLIGVHCTHGLNRTGLMICAHMIQQCNISPSDAVARFEVARGHKMERENYVKSLHSMMAMMQLTGENPSSEIIVHDNLRTISTQTDKGIWLENGKSKNKRKRRFSEKTDDIDDIKGTVLIDGSKLISDGSGGYYMRVELKDVRPLRSKSNSTVDSHRSQGSQLSHGKNCLHSGPGRSVSHYANRNPSHHSNYEPDPSGTFFPDNARYSVNNNRRNAEQNDRRFGLGCVQPFHQQKYFKESSGLFKY